MTIDIGAGATDKIVRFLQESFANGWSSVSFDNCVDIGVTLADLIDGTGRASASDRQHVKLERLGAEVCPDQDRGFCEVCGTNTMDSALVLAGII